MDKLLTRRQVTELTGMNEQFIYREVKAGRFPRQIRIAQRAVRWRESEIEAWLADCERRTDAA